LETQIAKNECFEAIGEAATNTEYIDLILMNTYRVVAGDSLDHAKTIFYGLDSVKARREITWKLARANGYGAEAITLLEELARAAKVANIARIELTRTFMRCSGEEDNPGIDLDDSSLIARPITGTYLEKRVKRTTKSVAEARDLYDRLCKMLEVSPEIMC